VLRSNSNNWDKLGKCAKKRPHNGSKCLASHDGTLRDERDRQLRRNDRRDNDPQPFPDASGVGVDFA